MTIPPIKFIRPLETDRWKLIEVKCLIDDKQCKICYTELKPIVSLVGDNQVDIGVCPDCGLCTYMQKLPQEYIDNYYDQVWMGETQEKAIAKAQERREMAFKDVEGKAEEFKELCIKYGMDFAKPFLDIGCGYGERLVMSQRAGFKDVMGIETSPVRAEAVRRTHNLNVFEGNFEEFAPGKKFGFIMCYHVLEHTYNPDEILRKCSEIQDVGDKIFFDLPNFLGEPSMGIVFFLPHLYSFTSYSLKKLFAKHGYGVFYDQSDAGNISLFATKLERVKIETEHDFYDEAVRKFQMGLGLVNPRAQVLEWQSHTEGALFMPKYYWERRDKRPINRTIAVEHLEMIERRTQSPIEFQFEGNVKLFYK